MKSKPFGFFHRQLEPVFTVGPSENSVLILEPVENRERSELGDPSQKNPQIPVISA
jgi:hypothetical protein